MTDPRVQWAELEDGTIGLRFGEVHETAVRGGTAAEAVGPFHERTTVRRGPRVRTWHVEMAAVGLVLAAVALARGTWTEWLAAGAVLATFGHASVAERLREQEAARDAKAVECHRWLGAYYVAKEVLWVAFFASTGAYAALVGCGVFLAYPIWRWWWRGRHG